MDCNAIAPAKAIRIAEIVAGAGAPCIDGGIIGLAPGKEIYALIKSVAIDRHSLGLAEPPKRN